MKRERPKFLFECILWREYRGPKLTVEQLLGNPQLWVLDGKILERIPRGGPRPAPGEKSGKIAE